MLQSFDTCVWVCCVQMTDSVVVSVGCLSSCAGYLLLAVSSLSWGGDWPIYLSCALQLNSVTTVAIRYTKQVLLNTT